MLIRRSTRIFLMPFEIINVSVPVQFIPFHFVIIVIIINIKQIIVIIVSSSRSSIINITISITYMHY